MKRLSLGVVGLGNVGAALVRLIEDRAAEIERTQGVRLEIAKAVARDAGRERGLRLAAGTVGTDALALARDPRVEVVVELMGGVEPAGAVVAAALEARKPVVTANKLLLAERGEALFALAAERGVPLRFEGAVCGGLPIVRLLREALAPDRVLSLHGILNGTTNYILSRMAESGASFDDALAEAQRAGFAEADPTLDLSGADAAQKLCLLARLAFGARVAPRDVLTEGIRSLTQADLAAAQDLGCVIKLLAIARRKGEALDLRVHPAMIPTRGPLSSVAGAFNAVLVQSEALGPTLLSGQGAGGSCTAEAVLADLVDIGRPGAGGPLRFTPGETVPLVPRSELQSSYYLRLTVDDAPGVLAAITAALGKRGISIAALEQRERRAEGTEPVAVVILSHPALEGGIQAAVAEIDGLPFTRSPAQLIRVETGAPLA
ncbi:MAG TPA: homoserine dehydrogenase [Myxococcales bacterium]|nr:homoserine dehydrogenase [Myxococcales bacterium]